MKKYAIMFLLLMVTSVVGAFDLKVYPDHMELFVPKSSGDVSIIAQSAVLGGGKQSLGRGVYVAATASKSGYWKIPSANKDTSVYFSVLKLNGTLKWFNMCPDVVVATSGHTDITHVTENTDCTISYRFKGNALAASVVSFNSTTGVLAGDMGTNVFYRAQNAHLLFSQVGRIEWGSSRCNWGSSSICTATPKLNTKGNLTFSIKTPLNDLGALSVRKAGTTGTRSWFTLSEWKNGTGVTRVGSDRLKLGKYQQGIIVFTNNILEINMGSDYLPTIPWNITGIKGRLVSDRLGWDFFGTTDTNPNNNGISMSVETDANGNARFRAYNMVANDELPLNDLMSNDSLTLVVTGMDGTTPKTYWLPLADFVQGSGVMLDTANNLIKYGNYAKPTIAVDLVSHGMKVSFNVDALAPLGGTVVPKRSLAGKVQFVSDGGNAYLGDIQKDTNGNFFANIAGLNPAGDCGTIAVSMVGSTDKAWGYDYNEDATKGIYVLVGATKAGVFNENGGSKFCF